MSRFVEVLNEWRSKKTLGIDIKGCVEAIVQKLDAKCGYLKFDFKYFINKKSPVTGISAPMCYDCFFEGILDNYGEEDEEYRFFLGVKVPVTTLCPCSKEISDYGAHNQRAIVSIKVTYPEDEHIWIEDLVREVEKCASSELYPLLKREDEKYVTERAYDNPKFVEDVLRDVVLLLRNKDVYKRQLVRREPMQLSPKSIVCAKPEAIAMTFFKLPPSSTPITSVFVYSLNLLGTLQAFCTNSAVSISSQATEAAVGFLIRTSFASVGPDNITTFCSGSTSLITSDIRIRVFNSKPFEALTRGVSGLIPAAFNLSLIHI